MDISKTIRNFIKTIECQRYITNQTIKEYVEAHTSEKYPNKNLNNVWNSCNYKFYSGVYLYLHRYQKIIKKNRSQDIPIKVIDLINNNTNKIYNVLKTFTDKNKFIQEYIKLALNENLDKITTGCDTTLC